ncbi:MAG: IS4 family transposase [Armatimonadetes bacterium]|nr:IS4 family transposase [Armatimonadota bacterium]
MSTPESAPRARRGRKPTEAISVEDLQGFKFFKRLRGLFDSLHGCAAHRNRKLFYDEYAVAVLFYFFNPAITSLRGLQTATGFEKVQEALGLRRMSLGSMSESVRVFDPALLEAVFEEMAANASERAVDPRLKDLRQVLTVVDGTILPALPRMAWAVWLRDTDRGAKAHVQFEVLKGVPVAVEITPGQSSEIERLRATLKAGRLYVVDRGYRDFGLMQAILEADSSFVSRLHANAVYEILEEQALTDEARQANVVSDRVVRLGGKLSAKKLHQPVRLVEVRVPAKPPRGLGYPVKKVSSKKLYREKPGEAYTLILCTDRLDLPADVIALIYLHRWKVELFFRLLKSVFGLRHLLSDSYEGVSIQVYAALIATLLLAEYTGMAASKKTYLLVTLYLQGWASLEELQRELGLMKAKAASKNA